jgi:hypothetical protein
MDYFYIKNIGLKFGFILNKNNVLFQRKIIRYSGKSQLKKQHKFK